MVELVTFVGESGARFTYKHDAVIGRGRYGHVFEGTDESSGNTVAVKALPIDTRTDTRYLVDGALVQRELEIMRHLKQSESPHVIPLLDFAWTSQDNEEKLLLVLPRAEYSLDEYVKNRGTFTEPEASELLRALVSGMTTIHTSGVLHRDINPRNILWLGDRWTLSDFGISKDYRQGPATSTWEGTGTFEYWSPELFRGDEASPQSDMFAAGATVLEAITGRVLFPGPRHIDQRLAFDAALPEIADRNLARVLALTLALEPTSRPKTAQDIIKALTIPTTITAAQRGLQELLAVHTDETRRRDEQFAKYRREQELRETGMGILRHAWSTFIADVQRIAPDATEAVSDEGDVHDFLRSVTIHSDRLSIEAGTTLDPSIALIVGQVYYNNADRQGSTCVANVICRIEGPDEIPSWSLTSYTSNYLARGHAPVAMKGIQDHGVDLPALTQQLSESAEHIAVRPLVEKSERLNSESLLTMLVESARRSRASEL